MGVNESKDSDNGPFCVAIQDTPQSLTKFDVLEAVKEFEPLDATRVQENRWIVSLKTKNQAERAIQAGKIPLPKEECTIFITACDQDEIAGIRKGKQQKESNQDSQPGGPSVTSPDTGQEFAFKTGPPSVQTGVSTVSPTKEIPTGQQSPYQPSTVKTQHDHYYPAMHHPFNPEGMDTRPQTHENGPGQQYPYKPNPMNMDYSFYNPAIPPPMAPIGINMIPQRNLNPPGQQYPYEPNPMNTGYGRYQPIMPPAMYPLGVNMRPPRTQNPPGQQYPYEPNPMNTGYGRYQPVMQPRMDELGMNMRPPRTQNLPGQQWPCKPNPVNMEVMQPLMDPKGMITRPMRPMRNQNRPGQMYPYQPNPLKKESNTVVKPLMDSIGMNTRPQINANENEEMKVVNIDKHVQKYITYPERRNEIKDKFTKVEITFPGKGQKKKVLTLRGPKNDVDHCAGYFDNLAKELAAGSYRTQVQFFKVLQENIIGINGAAIKRIREETGTCIEFPSENSDSDVIIITGMKDNVEAARGKIEAIQEELKVSNCTAEIRAKPEYHKLLRKRGGYNIRNVSEKTGACVMFPHSQATDRDLISLIGSKDAVDKAKAELESLITSLDNMVEDEVSVDPKHQSYFVAGKNKVLRQIEDEYDLVYISFPNKEVTNGRVILKGESDCVEGAKKRILEIVSDMDAQVTIECVIPMQHHRTVMGAKGANVQEISSLYAVEIKFPKRPVNGDTNIPNEVNGGREDEEMSPKASDVIKITGQPENTEKAKTALLALVPVTVEVTVPFKFHGHIIGHKGGNIRKMTEEFNVTFSIPRSEESSDLIKVTGVLTNVRRATAALEQKVVSLEKAGDDRPVKQFQSRAQSLFTKPQGIGQGITADALQMHFENEKKSGGGDVKALDFDPVSSAAIIEFEDPSVIDRVLRSLPIEIQGIQLKVEVSKERDESEHGIEEENENNGPPKTTVEIRGISKDTSTEVLELYFENKKRSGGGPVSRIEWMDNVALVTFESEADTNTVLLRSHRLNEMHLDVKLYTPPEPVLMYQNKLLIAGLNQKITEDCLTNFLEAKGGASLTEILYAEGDEQKALVTFEGLPDSKKIQDACQRKKLEGAELEVLQVPISRCIIATNVTQKTSKDMVEDYFKNTDRKGGGHVEKVEEMEGAFLIYFEDVKATESVLERKHVIDNCQIQLQLFHPCIEKTISVEKHRLKQTNWNVRQAEKLMHESVQEIKKSALPNNSRSKLKLLAMKETRNYLKQKLEENGCLGVWEIDKDCVIVCDISDQKANEGIQIIETCLVENIIKITPEEIIIINSEAWTVMLAAIDKQHKGYSIIDVHMQNATIEITSTDQYAGEIVKIVRDFLHANALYKQTITVERSKVRYLERWHRAQIDDICESKESRVKIEVNQGVITLEGRQKYLGEATNKISALLKQICCKQKSLEKPGIRKYLYSEKGGELIKQIENGSKCTIYLTNQEDDTGETYVYERDLEHQKHQQQPVECLNCRVPGGRSIFVYHGDITDFDIHMLISTCDKTLDQTAGLAKAVVEKGGDVILSECSQQKREKKLEGDVFFTNGGNLKCKIIAHGVSPMWQDGNNDEEEYLKEIVSNSLREADKRKLISIGIPAIGTGIFGFPVSLATKVIVRAVQEHFQVQNNSFVKTIYFCDLNAKHVTSFIEAVKKVFPASDWTCNQDPSQTTGQTSLPSLRESTGGSLHTTLSDSSGYCSFPRIRVIKGELACQQADILVNTTSQGLDLRQGAVSASLLTIGGQQLQDECTNKYPNGIKYGDIAITGPGGLRCKGVFHGCLPQWNNDGSALTVLTTFMKNCLSEANKMKMTSIIFPALGTGTLKYPKDVVAREMFKSASDFLAMNPVTSLVAVEFVIYEKDSQTLMEFEKEQKELFNLPSAHREKDGNAKSQTRQEPGNLGLGKDVSSPLTIVLHDDRMKAIIEICAESESAIQNAIDDVEEKCSKELDLDSITDEGIKLLSDDQISEIKKIAQKHNVKVTLQKRLGRMRIEGITTDVAKGKTEVLSLMRDIERNIYKEKQAAMLFQLVQWRYLKSTDKSQEWLDFDKNSNAKIEEAYQRKDRVLKLPGGNIIDFEALEQYSEMNPDIKVSVLRKDKIKDLVSEIPSQWVPMDNDNLRLIHLQPTSTEYSGVAGRFMTSVQKGNKHTNIQVLKIERIQNKTLYAQYQSKRKLIDEMNPGKINEMDLWHGTAGQAVNSINVHGFNRSFCGKNATMYGDGVYFAKEAYYSAREVYSPPDTEGNKRIYLTKVLTGKYTQGAQGMRVPPLLVSGQPELHDSVVDDVNKPFIFVIFHDTQAYPEYLITFKCN